MKKFDKAILTIFSIIILIEGIILCLAIGGVINYTTISTIIKKITVTEPANQITLLVVVICMLLSLKGIFWTKTASKKDLKSGKDVLMQNDNGRLMISTETIETLVNTVVKQFNKVQEAKTSIRIDQDNNVLVLVSLMVTKDVVIKELSAEIQNKIKQAIKNTSDLDVKEVNVRINNIVSAQEGEAQQ